MAGIRSAFDARRSAFSVVGVHGDDGVSWRVMGKARRSAVPPNACLRALKIEIDRLLTEAVTSNNDEQHDVIVYTS
jgi:hypothetical protein